jgi:hypothetical protein
MSEELERLEAKHGTPFEFAVACYNAVPGFISRDEADAAIKRYNDEWVRLSQQQKSS